MAPSRDTLRHAWNVFTGRERANMTRMTSDTGMATRSRGMPAAEQTIVASIQTRISIDVAAVMLLHAMVDENERFIDKRDSDLNKCLLLAANIDQGARAFKQDMVQTMLERGVAIVVPVETSLSPDTSGGYDIRSMRVGTPISWHPRHVGVRLYDDRDGQTKERILPKSTVAIIENPFYTVMNEPNSTLNRLKRKLYYLDTVDKASASGKLDLIIQLPYSVKSEQRKATALKRRNELEEQLSGSKYGVAWTDGTEKVTQLNRPAENNLLSQVQYLTEQLYGELGMTPEVMNGTADEKTMINYYNRTIEPILAAISNAMTMKFVTKTGYTQGQRILYLNDPFKLIDVATIADMADKFTRNEIMSSNEFRAVVGLKPSKDKAADELRNKNIPEPDPNPEKDSSAKPPEKSPAPNEDLEGDNQNGT